MEYELLQMENESLKLELGRNTSAFKRSRNEGLDSGDFNSFSETAVDAEGRITGLLGALQAPLVVPEELKAREQRINTYFRNKLSEINTEKQMLESKSENYIKEVRLSIL